MAKVMNRVARRAARKAQPAVETGIYIVPMGCTEAYYHAQIAQEGMWNPDPPVIVTRPKEEFGRADEAWLQRTLSQMRKVREPGTNRYVFPGESGQADTDIDIGLIDVQIYFDAYSGEIAGSPMTDENLRQVDRLCGGQLHTQMVLASAVHRYRPDGSLTLHYHNLIFGLRKEMDGNREHIGIIDLLPLVHALGNGRTVNIIEEV
jgi:hypothetical protein